MLPDPRALDVHAAWPPGRVHRIDRPADVAQPAAPAEEPAGEPAPVVAPDPPTPTATRGIRAGAVVRVAPLRRRPVLPDGGEFVVVRSSMQGVVVATPQGEVLVQRERVEPAEFTPAADEAAADVNPR